MHKLTRVGTYVRMSTDRQEDSPERQLSTILPYLEKKPGYKEVDRYQDLGVKGWTDDRPELQRLLRDAAAGKLDLILVDQGSRLSRQSPIDFFALVAHPLKEAGVAVESVQSGRILDWNNIGDFLCQSVDQYQSHGESKNTAWRVLTDFCRRAKGAYLFIGPTPYGFKKVRKEDGEPYDSSLPKETRGTPTLVPGDVREVEVVRFIFDAYGNRGLSLSEITLELARRGVRTPKGGTAWRQSTLGRWLRDPVYIGTYRFNVHHYGKFYCHKKDGPADSDRPKDRRTRKNPKEDWIVIPESHQGLVDSELFYRVQDLLTHNKRVTTPGRQKREFLFTGLLMCGHCGARMTGSRVSYNGKDYGVVYRCFSSYDAGRDLPRTIREDELRRLVLGAIQDFVSLENLNRLRALVSEEVEKACQPKNLDLLKEEKARLAKQIDRAQRNLSILEDLEDVKAVQADIKGWRERTGQIDDLLREAEKPAVLAMLEEAIKEMEAALWALEEAVRSRDPKQLRILLARFIQRVSIFTTPEVIGKNRHRYNLDGGVIHLKPGSALSGQTAEGLLNLSHAGPTTGQVSGWIVRFGAEPESFSSTFQNS